AGQRKRLEEIQKEIDVRLETLLTEDQKKQLQAMQRRPAAGGPGRGGPPGGGPLFRAVRYATSFPGFAGKDLIPGKSLEELQPKDSEKKEAEKKGGGHDSRRPRIRKPTGLNDHGLLVPIWEAEPVLIGNAEPQAPV